MKNNIVRHPLWLFSTALTWVVLYGIVEFLKQTEWGISGDPSNAIVLSIYLILSSPLFGASGIIYALFDKTSHRFHAKAISLVLNFFLVIGGIGFWLWWFT